MKFRLLDDNNDWVFGSGLSSFAKDEKAVNLNLLTSLRTIKGENWCDKNLGISWISMMAQKEIKPLDLLMVRDYMLSCSGVLSVNNLDIIRDENRKIKLKYTSQTVYNYNISETTEVGIL